MSDVFSHQSKFFKAVNLYPVKATYTLVYSGKPTLEGLRGFSIAKTIKQVGASNQENDAVLEILHGPNTERP